MREWLYRSTLTSVLAEVTRNLHIPSFYPNVCGRKKKFHPKGGWLGPRTGLDDMVKRNFLILLRLELQPSVVGPVASRYTDCGIPAGKQTTFTDVGYFVVFFSLEKCRESTSITPYWCVPNPLQFFKHRLFYHWSLERFYIYTHIHTVRPRFDVFVEGSEKERRIRGSDKCGGHSLSSFCSRTSEIEQWVRQKDTSANDRPRFAASIVQWTAMNTVEIFLKLGFCCTESIWTTTKFAILPSSNAIFYDNP
jgi:hypothetical protein